MPNQNEWVQQKQYNDTPNASSREDMGNFGKFCTDGNDSWYKYIKNKHPYKIENVIKCQQDEDALSLWADDKETVLEFDKKYKNKTTYYYNKNIKIFSVDPCEYIKMFSKSNLQNRLGNFRHTEIQVQALLNAYEEASKNANEKNSARTKVLEALLPATLVKSEKIEDVKDKRVYSLFEACDACEKTQWLKGKNRKDTFMFRVLDNQYTMGFGKPNIKKGFMSQKTLEGYNLKGKILKKENLEALGFLEVN